MPKIFLTMLLIAATFLNPFASSAQQAGHAYSDMAADILRYVNEHRTSMGLKPLKVNDIVIPYAEKHSRNMATHKLPFGHDGFDERMDKISKQIKSANSWAENVAYSTKSAKEVVEMWLHSPGHKKNIEGDYNLTGIGIAKSDDGNLYFTQIFVKSN